MLSIQGARCLLAQSGSYLAMINDIVILGLVWALLAGGTAVFTLMVVLMTRD